MFSCTASAMTPLEQTVPEHAREATLSAYQRALQVSQQGVLTTDDGELVRVSAGTQLQYRTEEIPDWFFEAYVDEVEP